MQNEEVNSLVEMVMVWRRRGYSLIPCQPSTKQIVKGFGLYQKRVENDQDIKYWFQDRNCNLAVACPENSIILDFDRIELYNEFWVQSPELAESYTEYTPRGGRHVFLESTSHINTSLIFIPGIEIKKFCLVYPSRVNGQSYGISNPGCILRGDVLKSISRFLVNPGENTGPRQVQASLRPPGVIQGVNNHKRGILTRVKENWSILDYLQFFEPNLILRGKGRFLSGLCPWHNDRHPSLWIDTELNQWGCHACKKFGDIINWHSLRLNTLDMGRAARDLARYEISFALKRGSG